MRRLSVSVLALGLGLLANVATAQVRDRYVEQCQDQNEDIAIAGCTALIESGVESERNLSVSFFHRGRAHFRSEEHDSAVQDFSEAIRLRPNFLNAFFQRGDVYLALEDYDSAIRDFGEVVRLNPEDAIAFKYRGDAYLAKGETALAIQDYDEALRLDPNDADAIEARARVSVSQ